MVRNAPSVPDLLSSMSNLNMVNSSPRSSSSIDSTAKTAKAGRTTEDTKVTCTSELAHSLKTAADLTSEAKSVGSKNVTVERQPYPYTERAQSPAVHEHAGLGSLQNLKHRPSLQLFGHDEHTKRLMNRVATGRATQAEQAMFDSYVEGLQGKALKSRDTEAKPTFNKREDARFLEATPANAKTYTKAFCDFLTDNPTVFHAVDATKSQLEAAGFENLNERDSWAVKPSGRYYVERNGSSLIAFTVGAKYESGNGAAILAGHIDALTVKLKPISKLPTKAGYTQLGVAPYAGGMNSTWWDRDLGIGGRVIIQEGDKIVSKLVKLDWPIAKIPTLAPHFGAAANGPFNPETQMVPIIGLESRSAVSAYCRAAQADPFSEASTILEHGREHGSSFCATQPPGLVQAIGSALGLQEDDMHRNVLNWELELFDVQPATVGGLHKDLIFAGRIDDKLCSWAAIQALIKASSIDDDSSIIKVAALFDDEEIGSLLRQGARGNFLPSVLERAVGALASPPLPSDLMGRTYANSFLVSSDVCHAVNPNFLNAYLENHAPHLNVGLVVSADPNGHMTTDAVSTTILQQCANKVGAKLQVFQIRNDSRSGGTVGPMLSAMTGIRAIDAGMPQLSMHSIRATTGALDPGLGVLAFIGFLNGFEGVDRSFRS